MIDFDPIALEDDALDWVNEQREKLDLPTLAEMPKGVRGATCDCPVARALTPPGRWASTLTFDTVIGDEREKVVTSAEGLTTLDHPEFVQRFIHAFDRGAFPHLIDTVPLKQEAF